MAITVKLNDKTCDYNLDNSDWNTAAPETDVGDVICDGTKFADIVTKSSTSEVTDKSDRLSVAGKTYDPASTSVLKFKQDDDGAINAKAFGSKEDYLKHLSEEEKEFSGIGLKKITPFVIAQGGFGSYPVLDVDNMDLSLVGGVKFLFEKLYQKTVEQKHEVKIEGPDSEAPALSAIDIKPNAAYQVGNYKISLADSPDGNMFKSGAAVLEKWGQTKIDEYVKEMEKWAKIKQDAGIDDPFYLFIKGHTDIKGKAGKNMTLSNDRAKAVKTYLIGKIESNTLLKQYFPSDNIQTKGYGETSPAIDVPETASGEEHAPNRRVEILVFENPEDMKNMVSKENIPQSTLNSDKNLATQLMKKIGTNENQTGIAASFYIPEDNSLNLIIKKYDDATLEKIKNTLNKQANKNLAEKTIALNVRIIYAFGGMAIDDQEDVDNAIRGKLFKYGALPFAAGGEVYVTQKNATQKTQIKQEIVAKFTSDQAPIEADSDRLSAVVAAAETTKTESILGTGAKTFIIQLTDEDFEGGQLSKKTKALLKKLAEQQMAGDVSVYMELYFSESESSNSKKKAAKIGQAAKNALKIDGVNSKFILDPKKKTSILIAISPTTPNSDQEQQLHKLFFKLAPKSGSSGSTSSTNGTPSTSTILNNLLGP